MNNLFSINTKECLAIYYGVHSFLHILQNKYVCIRSDSSAAVSVATKMGCCSSKICDMTMRDLWTLSERYNMWFTIVHIPGILNIQADRSSREFNDRIIWTLPQVYFEMIHTLHPEIDVVLFTSYTNKKIAKYVTWKYDPFTIHAFSLNWNVFNLHNIFAPNSVNLKVL